MSLKNIFGRITHPDIAPPRPGNALTIQAKYIFMDIVGYTHKRSVEAQTKVIGILNSIVSSCINRLSIPSSNLIFLPTGDGICIALLYIRGPYDIHIQLSLRILEEVAAHNASTPDEPMHIFNVRIGINENIDNLVTDINGKTNVAGSGINFARRIMDQADGNQLLVSQAVYDILSHREIYMGQFRAFTTRVKHGETIVIHQYIQEGIPYLNIDIPTSFMPQEHREPKLTKLAAYYFAHSIANREFLESVTNKATNLYVARVLLYFRALDSVLINESSRYEDPMPRTPLPRKSFEDQFEYLYNMHYWVICMLSRYILSDELSAYDPANFYDEYNHRRFISNKGAQKLQEDWPDIWDEIFPSQPESNEGIIS